MICRLISFFMFAMMSANAFARLSGNVGFRDDRRYGQLSELLYSAVARVEKKGVTLGTAGFISENLIITNRHVSDICIKIGCSIYFWDGKQYQTSDVHLVTSPKEYNSKTETDWVIMKSDIPNKHFMSVAPESTPGNVLRGGFGTLRIIADSEIPLIKQAYREAAKEKCTDGEERISCLNRNAKKILQEKYNLKPLFGDQDNFKVQNCKILKVTPEILTTNCDSSGGDSGAPLIRGNQIVGLNVFGFQDIFRPEKTSFSGAINTRNFYDAVQRILSGQVLPELLPTKSEK